VLLRALARTPAARYASAAAFRDDIERWLEGRPVSALPPSRLHALRKFVARNRLAVAASAAAALALVAVSVVAVLQAQRATRSAAEAQAEAAKANATKDFLLSTYASADPTTRGGRDATAKELLIEAEKQLDAKLKGQPELQAEVLGTVEIIWDRLGDVEKAQTAADRRTEVLLGAGDRMGAAASMLSSAETAIKRRAFVDVSRRLSKIERLVDIKAMPAGFQGRFLYLRGNALAERGDRRLALATLNQSIALSSAVNDDRMTFLGLVSRVFLQRTTGDPVSLRRDLAKAESLLQRLDSTPVDALGNRSQLVIARYLLGDYMGGWPEMQSVILEADRLFGSNNPGSFNERTYWLRFCLRLRRTDLAVGWLRDAEMSGKRSPLREYGRDPQWHLLVARVQMAERNWSATQFHLSEAMRTIDDIQENGAETTEVGEWRSRLALHRAEFELLRGRPAQARGLLSSTRARSGELLVDETYVKWWVLGLAALAESRPRESIENLRRAEKTAVALLGVEHPDVALIRVDIARAGAAANSGMNESEVLALIQEAAPVLRRAFPASHPVVSLMMDIDPALRGAGSASFSLVRHRLVSVPSDVFFM
jgi:hypothetical protein